jgi:hypothetical protein
MRRCWTALLGLTLTAAAALPKSYLHPNLRSKKGRSVAVRNVLLLPPKVQDFSVGFRGMETLGSEGARLAELIREWVELALRDREFRLAPSPFSPNADPDRLYSLASLQQRYEQVLAYMKSEPGDVRRGRYTLSHEIGRFMADSTADSLVFVRAVVLKRRSLASLYVMGCSIALVQVRTGDVLFYSQVYGVGDLRTAEFELQRRLAVDMQFLSAGGLD